MARYKRTYNPCDDCPYSYSKNNQDSGMCKICEFKELLDSTTADVVETKRISEILAVLFENNIVEKYIPNTANAGSWEDFLRKACSGEYGMLR